MLYYVILVGSPAASPELSADVCSAGRPSFTATLRLACGTASKVTRADLRRHSYNV